MHTDLPASHRVPAPNPWRTPLAYSLALTLAIFAGVGVVWVGNL